MQIKNRSEKRERTEGGRERGRESTKVKTELSETDQRESLPSRGTAAEAGLVSSNENASKSESNPVAIFTITMVTDEREREVFDVGERESVEGTHLYGAEDKMGKWGRRKVLQKSR